MSVEAPKRQLNVAVVRFPGSNCDDDTIDYFNYAGHNAFYVFHKETETPEADLLVLPGGFAYGDRKYVRATHDFTIEPGVQALNSPVMRVIDRWVGDGRPALGICNGFQIFTLGGHLPGKLEQNDSHEFFCNDVDLRVEGRSFLGDQSMLGNVYKLNIAHGYGKYTVTAEEYAQLLAKDQIFLRYQGFNPNGSFENIAGICNEQGNVWGMMPHPERGKPPISTKFMEAIVNYVRN